MSCSSTCRCFRAAARVLKHRLLLKSCSSEKTRYFENHNLKKLGCMIYPSLRKTGFFRCSRSCHCFWTTTQKLAHEILCNSKNARTFLNSQPQKTQLYDTSYFFQSQAPAVVVRRVCACFYLVCIAGSVFIQVYMCFRRVNPNPTTHLAPPRSLSHTFLPLPPFHPSLPTIPRARSPHAC